MGQHRKRKRQSDEFVFYVVTIEGWDSIYGISATQGRPMPAGLYEEMTVLELTGNVFQPDDPKYPRAKITLYGKEGMLGSVGDEPTKSIGMVEGTDDGLSIWANIPAERMAGVMTLAASNRIRAALFTGTRLRYRRGAIHNLELMTRFDKEEY